MVSCLNPRVIFNSYSYEHMTVPCGHCSACKSLLVNTWKNRLYLEANAHRYVYFLTLTYTDDHLPKLDVNVLYDDANLDNEVVSSVLSDSCDYLGLLGSTQVPCVNVRDTQLFFKRLRYYISQDSKVYEKTLRYFLVAEYGPTTFRPHYHCLLFFDDAEISYILPEIVYKSWQFANSSPKREFAKRNRLCRVCGDAVQYVAGYLNCHSELPAVLTLGVFRPFHTCSKRPPIGLFHLTKDTIFRFLAGHADVFTLKKSVDSASTFSFHVWSGFEGRYVPRCRHFSALSSVDRRAIYMLSSLYGKETSFAEFYSRLCSDWFSSYPVILLLRSIFGDECETPKFLESVRRAWYLSKRVSYYAKWFGFTVQEYVDFIEAYYDRKEYSCLTAQLALEEKYVLAPPADCVPLKYLPLLIDSLFYANLRNLPSSTVTSYLEQFKVDEDLSLLQPKYTAAFRKAKYTFDKIQRDAIKRSRKSEYVATHPEYLNLYLSSNPLLNYV